MTEEKLTHKITVAVGDGIRDALDEYIERRSRETRIALSRSLAVRELLEALLIRGRFSPEMCDPNRARAYHDGSD